MFGVNTVDSSFSHLFCEPLGDAGFLSITVGAVHRGGKYPCGSLTASRWGLGNPNLQGTEVFPGSTLQTVRCHNLQIDLTIGPQRRTSLAGLPSATE